MADKPEKDFATLLKEAITAPVTDRHLAVGKPYGEAKKSLYQQVVENQQRLAGCAYHTFEVSTPHNSILLTIHKCTACNGTVDGRAHCWHQQGRRAKPEETP